MKRLRMPVTTLTTLSLRKIAFTVLCCTALMVFAASAQTVQSIKVDPGTNNPPPAGPILDLGGTYATPPTAAQPIPGNGTETYQNYTVNFTANASNSTCTDGGCSTIITFAFRDDPAQVSFTNASVTDITNPSLPGPNLLTNGNFATGSLAPWTYVDTYGVTGAGFVALSGTYENNCPSLAGVAFNCWIDGAVQAYDAISQTIATNPGDTYQISFFVAENSGIVAPPGASNLPAGYPGSACYFALANAATGAAPAPCYFSDLSTNGDESDAGGSGINVAAYALPTVPVATQQETLTVTGAGAGSGTVLDTSYEEINCTITAGSAAETGCTASYPINTNVTLTANAAEGSTFGGWGGACASYGTSSPCTVAMSMAQNVIASFNAPGPTQVGTVTTAAPTVYSQNGGYTPNSGGSGYTGGYNSTVQLTSSNESPELVQVTAIPSTSTSCNQLLATLYPGGNPPLCFVYQNGAGTAEDASVEFAVTCPGSSSGGACTPNFFANIASNFYINTTNDNQGLTWSNNTLFYEGGNPYVGVIRFAGSGINPCLLTTPLAEPPSNQVISLIFTDGNPTPAPLKGGSQGTGSCWLFAYNMPNETPSTSITAPTNGSTFQQGQAVNATFACNAVNEGSTSPVGPYLTLNSCTLTDTYTGAGSPASYPASFTGGTSSVTYTTPIDTTYVGTHTLIATVVDSATNTVSSTPVTYNVVAATNVAISNAAFCSNPPASCKNGTPPGGKLTYVIGVGDLGPANAVNVVVTDTLAPGTSFVSASGTNIGFPCITVGGKISCKVTSTPITCSHTTNPNGTTTVSCPVGTIMPISLFDLNGAVIDVTAQVSATAPKGTTLTNTATVSQSNVETKQDNSSSVTTTVN